MVTHEQKSEKLRKIKALAAKTTSAGERAAAEAAAERILRSMGVRPNNEVRPPAARLEERAFSILDTWCRRLFVALCRRHKVPAYRHSGMRSQTVVVLAPPDFMDQVLWPEFEEMSERLQAGLLMVTEKMIVEELEVGSENLTELEVRAPYPRR